eukprot:m51a1_g4405 hypothetical protein (400) ;mRNA; f:425170-426494
MGMIASKAKAAAEEKKNELERLVTALQNRLDAFEAEVKLTRGSGEGRTTEVSGGRTIMRVSEVRVASSTDVDKELTAGIDSFFAAAQAAVAGDDQSAKQAAVEGAKNVLTGGIRTLLGVSNGQSMTKKSFVVLFINNAFVRVDYYIYSYSVSATKWGVEADSSGVCYLADLAVLQMKDLHPEEIDFLTSQALQVAPGDFNTLIKVKVNLTQVAVLSRVLQRENLSYKEITEICKELAASQAAVAEAFAQLPSRSEVRARSFMAPGVREQLEREIEEATEEVNQAREGLGSTDRAMLMANVGQSAPGVSAAERELGIRQHKLDALLLELKENERIVEEYQRQRGIDMPVAASASAMSSPLASSSSSMHKAINSKVPSGSISLLPQNLVEAVSGSPAPAGK